MIKSFFLPLPFAHTHTQPRIGDTRTNSYTASQNISQITKGPRNEQENEQEQFYNRLIFFFGGEREECAIEGIDTEFPCSGHDPRSTKKDWFHRSLGNKKKISILKSLAHSLGER